MKESISKESIKQESIKEIDNEENIIKRAKISHLKPIYIEVLLVMAVNGPLDPYTIAHLIRKKEKENNQSRVHYAVEDLKEMRLLEFVEKKKSEKNREKHIHGLTEYGLCKALISLSGSFYQLAFEDPLWKRIDGIIEIWKTASLKYRRQKPLAPLIFSKWHDFLEKVPREEVIYALYHAMDEVNSHYMWRRSREEAEKIERREREKLERRLGVRVGDIDGGIEGIEADGIDVAFFNGVSLDGSKLSTDKWISAIREDGELNGFAIKSLIGGFRSHAHDAIHWAKNLVRYVEALKELGGDKIIEGLIFDFKEALNKAVSIKGSTETEQKIFSLITYGMLGNSFSPEAMVVHSALLKGTGPQGALLEEEELEATKNIVQKSYKKKQKRQKGAKE